MHLVKTHLVFQKKIYIQDGDDAQCISVINKLINGIHIFFNSDSFQIVLLLQQPLIPCFFFLCRPSTPPRSFPTRRASCCCGRQPKSSAGPSTTAPSLWCGEEAASSEGTFNFTRTNIASSPLCHIVQLKCHQACFTLMLKTVVVEVSQSFSNRQE